MVSQWASGIPNWHSESQWAFGAVNVVQTRIYRLDSQGNVKIANLEKYSHIAYDISVHKISMYAAKELQPMRGGGKHGHTHDIAKLASRKLGTTCNGYLTLCL